MENQASGTGFMLEVPEVNISEFIGADGKNEIVPVLDEPENAQNGTKLCVPER